MLKVQLFHICLRINVLLHKAFKIPCGLVPICLFSPVSNFMPPWHLCFSNTEFLWVPWLISTYVSGLGVHISSRRASWPLDEISLLPILTAFHMLSFVSVVVVQSLRCVWVFVSPWTAVLQASLSFIISQSLLKFKSIELVIPSSHIILCHLLLLRSVFPNIRVSSNESALHIRWSEYQSFSFSICPSNGYSGLIPFRID